MNSVPIHVDLTIPIHFHHDPVCTDPCSDVLQDMFPDVTVDGTCFSQWHNPVSSDDSIERIVEKRLDEFEHRVLTHLRLQNRSTVTVSEAADLLGVSVYAVRRWLNEGKLKGNKSGSRRQDRWSIRLQDIEAFQSAYTNHGGPMQ